jgi:hypothetical protein
MPNVTGSGLHLHGFFGARRRVAGGQRNRSRAAYCQLLDAAEAGDETRRAGRAAEAARLEGIGEGVDRHHAPRGLRDEILDDGDQLVERGGVRLFR